MSSQAVAVRVKCKPMFSTGQTIVGYTDEGERIQGSISMISDNYYRVIRANRHYAVIRSTAKLPSSHIDEHIAAMVLSGLKSE